MNRKFIQNSNLVLRKILHNENCLDILKDFIETFLKIQIGTIKINKTPIIDGKKSKEYGIVDVRVVTNEKEEINIGIQIIDGDYIQNKMLLYYAKIHSNQVLYGDNRKIARTITINIVDIEYFKSGNSHSVIRIKTNVKSDNALETMELHVLELPKLNNSFKEKISNKEAWVMYLKGTDENAINIAIKQNEKIKKLDNLLRKYWEEEKI